MNTELRISILAGMGFYGVWIAFTLLFSTNTFYLLLLGLLASLAFGGTTYWFNSRRLGDHQEHITADQ